MAAKNAELRVSTGVTFSGTDQLVYLKTHWNLLDGIPLSFTPTAHTHSGVYEPVITKGTTLQYFRGDMSLATMPTTLPASDVYAWAKASVKPAYTYSDVGASAAGHTHAYAPTSHASSATTYGLGTTANYGHVKTINALTQTSHADGTALSAYQGYVLNTTLGNKAPTSHATNGSTYGYGTTTNAGHLRVGEGITVSSGTISNSKLGSLVTISGNTTLALATHANKTIEVNSLATITIPPNSSVAFPIGTEIDFIRTTSSNVTFAPGSGVTLYSESSKRKINAQYQAATLKKTATNIWVLIGALK